MFCTIKDFADYWAHHRENTLKLFRNLTDDSLDQRIYDQGRSIRELAWHVVLCLVEMPGHVGLSVDGPAEDAPAPKTAAEILEAYEKTSRSLGEAVESNWTDAELKEEVNMYGEMWTKGKILTVLVIHEVHHLGQLTVLMRQAGLRVPGIYGPSREEWAEMGMPEMV